MKAYNIELLARAEDELIEAYDWYETNQTGLGTKFYNEINSQLSLIETNPLHYPSKYPGNLHTAPLKKFPFIVIYWIDEENQLIIVLSIFHTSRNPRYF